MLTNLLISLAVIPLLGLLASLVVPKTQERTVFGVAMATIVGTFLAYGLLGWGWLASGMEPISANIGTLYSSPEYAFTLALYFDVVSAVFLGAVLLISALVFIFSRFYMHREPGFKRFFYTALFFLLGLVLTIVAGNFEVLLVGWECIGLSSVLLIAFYRDRFLPARNALKVFSVYRIADAFLLGAIWYAHHIFATSVDFADFSAVAAQHGDELAVLGALLLVVAMVKSAQFPFSYWLPRAMEGPTSSSAIFYGSLSVHMGVFLLIRTYPLWESSTGLRIAIAVVGIVTALVATSIVRVQSSIKTQIAYASVTQIGIMLVEVALGLWWLALIHFVSNAILRTYQLLISPSIVGYLVHDQFFHFALPAQRMTDTAMGRLRATLYVLGVQEWHMNAVMNRVIWKPLKSVGRVVRVLDRLPAQVGLLVLAAVGSCVAAIRPDDVLLGLVVSVLVVSVLLYIRAYTLKKSALTAWSLVMLGHVFGVLGLAMASVRHGEYVVMYGVGILVAYIVGLVCLHLLERRGESLLLDRYQGLIDRSKKLGYTFFVACMLFMVFPIGPSFLAQDILLSLISEQYGFLVVLYGASYVMMGVSVMRLYTKLFYGAHAVQRRVRAYKSA